MKIKETYISHTGIVDVGRLAFFIDVSRDGIYTEHDELVKQAIHFPRIVLLGEPFEQSEETAKLCKKLVKERQDITIEINTNGMNKPLGVVSLNNVVYNVHLQLKILGIEYEQRIKSNIINWFNDVDSNFIFNVNIDDEIDETVFIVQENNIKKKNVFITFNNSEQLDEIRQLTKLNGFNFAPNIGEFLWPTDGRK